MSVDPRRAEVEYIIYEATDLAPAPARRVAERIVTALDKPRKLTTDVVPREEYDRVKAEWRGERACAAQLGRELERLEKTADALAKAMRAMALEVDPIKRNQIFAAADAAYHRGAA